MKSQKDSTDKSAEPAFESDALRLSDIAGRDAAETGAVEPAGVDESEPPGFVEEEQEIAAKDNTRGIILAVAAVGVAAAVVIGFKIAYDRRKASHRYRRVVVDHLEDARDTLMSVASDLPERGREVLHQLTRR